MNQFTDLFENRKKAAPKLSTEEWAEKKKAEKELAYQTINEMANLVSTDYTKFQEYLDVQSRFPTYSSNNALLIMAQMPEATELKDSKSIKEEKIYVTKGEKSFTILEPGDQYEKDDGTIGVGYNPKSVFDISQTNATQSKKKYPSIRTAVKSLIDNAPVEFKLVDTLENNNLSFYDKDTNTILLAKELQQDQNKMIIHLSQELAHAEIANKNPNDYTRGQANFHAYCISYMTAKKFGIDTSNFNFEAVPNVYEGIDDVQDIKHDLSDMQSAYKSMSERVQKNLYLSEQKKTQPER